MESQDLISVIIPVYRVEKELAFCLDSLLAQTYSNFELLLIDDGSPDNSFQIMERYAEKDSRVRLFRKKNGGVSSARNLGLEQAQGDYICFVDSDDYVAPQYLQWLHEALVQSGTAMAFCQFHQVFQDDMTVFGALPSQMPSPERKELVHYSVWDLDAYMNCWRIMVSAEVLKDLRFDETLYIGEDALFVMQAMLRTKQFAALPCALYAYRIRPDSAIHQPFSMKQYTEVTAWETIYALFAEQKEFSSRSIEELLVFNYANVYYHMICCPPPHSDIALEKELIHKIRTHWRAVLRMPMRQAWKKWKTLILMLCPPAGRLMCKLWNISRVSFS